MAKIGLLGGSFNPIHQGHIHIARCVRKALNLKEVWFLPAMQNPFKDNSIVDIDVRADEDGIVFPHPDHRLCIPTKVQQGLAERREATLKTLDEIDLHDSRELQGQGVSVTVTSAGI